VSTDFLNTLDDAAPTEAQAPAQAEAQAPVAAPMPPASDADKARKWDFVDTLEDEVSPTEQAYRDTLKIDPARAAQVRAVSAKLGEDPAFVDKNLDHVAKVADAPPSAFWKRLEAEHPEAAEWFASRQNMAVAKDDIGALEKIAKVAKDSAAGFRQGRLNVRQAELGWEQLFQTLESGAASQYGEAELQAIEKEQGELASQAQDHPWYHPAGAAEQLPNLFAMARQSAVRATQGGLAGAAAAIVGGQAGPQVALPEEVVTVPAATATGLGIGARLGAAEAAAMMEGGAAFREFVKLKNKAGEPVDPRLAASVALAVGGVNAGLEYAALTSLVKVLPGGERLLGAVTESQKIFKGLTAGAAVKQAAKLYLQNVATEGLTEAVQEGVTIAGGEALKTASAGEFDRPAASDVLSQVASAGLKGAGASLYLGGAASSARIAVDLRQISKAEKVKEVYQALGEAAGESQLRDRLPEAHRDYVAAVTKDGPVENVFLPAEAMQTLFQTKGLDSAQAARELGIEKEFQAALESGQKVKIPLSVWTEKVVGTTFYQDFADDVTFNPEDFSVNEAKALQSEIESEVEAEFKAAQESAGQDPGAAQSELAQVEEVFRKELQANRSSETSQDQVNVQARLAARIAVIQAKRFGGSAMDYAPGGKVSIVSSKRPYEPAAIQSIREEVAAGSQIMGGVTKDSDQKWDASTTGRFGIHSDFPTWFQGKGYTKKETLAALDKYLAGKKLGKRQATIVADLYEASPYKAAVKPAERVAEEPFLQRDGKAKAADIPAGFSRPESIEVTRIDQAALSEERHQSVVAAKADIATRLQKPGHVNSHTGWSIDLPAEAVSKLSSGRTSPAFLTAATHLDKLLERAIYVGEEANTNEKAKSNIPAFHVFYAPMQVGEKSYLVRLKVKEVAGGKDAGKKAYHLVAVESERPAGTSEAAPITGNRHSAFSEPSKITLPQFLADLNAAGSQHVWFQDEGDGAHGKITFTAIGAIIELGKTANASTFLHELSHLWLQNAFAFARENGSQLPADFAADWKKIQDYLGVTDDQASLTTEQQEKWARSFEAYLFEGKAPTSALQGAFDKLAIWMREIYREVRRLGVELNPEIRSVFDRMLVSEDEIQAAEQSMKRQPLQTKVEGLDPAVVAKLETLQRRAREEAVQTLATRLLEEISADRKAFLAEKRTEAEKEARELISERPVYKAQAALKEALKDKRSVRQLAKALKDGKLKEDQAGAFELMAETHGFSSGDHLATEILAARELDAEVQASADQAMLKYADLKDTSAIREEAEKAVFSNHSYELMALENEILEGLIKGAEVDQSERKRRMEAARIEAAAIKARARQLIWSLPIREATNVRPLIAAERRAAVSVARALAANHHAGAASNKRRQMLNHALIQEALRLRKKTEGWTNFLADLRTRKVESFKKEQHFVQVAHLLSKLGYERSGYNPQLRTQSLKDWANSLGAETNAVNIPDWILAEVDNPDSTRLKDAQKMSVLDLQDAINALRNVVKVANLEDRALMIGDGAALADIKTKLRLAYGLSKKHRKGVKPKMDPTALDLKKRSLHKYNLELKTIRTVLGAMQGWQDFGEWSAVFDEPVHKSADRRTELMEADLDELKRLWGLYSESEKAELQDKRVYHEALGTSATKMRLIMMALNLGNEDNRIKLTQNRPVGLEDSKAWDESVVLKLLAENLDERDWQFVQGVWDLLESKWPEIKALQQEMTGFAPPKVPAVPFNIQIGQGMTAKVITLRGGYFPLKEDPSASIRASEREEADGPLYTESNPSWNAMTRHGHTKARTSAQYSVALDPTIITRHLQNVNHDIAFRKVVVDLRRLINDEEVQGMLIEGLGIDGARYVKEWVAAVAGNNATPTQEVERWMAGVRKNVTTAAMSFRASVLFENISNVFRYGNAVDGFTHKDALRAAKTWMVSYWAQLAANPKGFIEGNEMREFVFQHSAFMRDKHASPEFSLAEAETKTFGTRSVVRDAAAEQLGGDSVVVSSLRKGSVAHAKMLEFGQKLMALSDEMTSVPMWMAAYRKGLDEKGMEHAEAVFFADSLIKNTVGSARRHDVSALQRSNNQAVKWITMFYGFFNTVYNRLLREHGKASVEGNARLLPYYATYWIMGGFLGNLLAGKGPNDDEDPLVWYLGNLAKGPLGMFPLVRDVGNVVLDRALGLRSFGYKVTPIQSGFDTLLKGLDAFDSEKEFAERLESVAQAATVATGTPDQFRAWLFNASDIAVNGMTPQVDDLYRRRPKNER
jgi:hypothetical protein